MQCFTQITAFPSGAAPFGPLRVPIVSHPPFPVKPRNTKRAPWHLPGGAGANEIGGSD